MVHTLTHEEKVLLAGAIRATIVGDGTIEGAELDDLDRIYQRLNFQDYEQCLEEYERQVPDAEAFDRAARAITNPEARDVILQVVYDLSLHSGTAEGPQERVFDRLNAIWRGT
jgi:hypothetical protein